MEIGRQGWHCSSAAWRAEQAGEREWFAVHVWTGREQSSAGHLRARGYDVFLPCYEEQRRWSDRVKRVNRALFPGYLFCRVSATAAARIVTAPGVIRIVGNADGPVPIRTDEIAAIERLVEARLHPVPCHFLRVGERVRLDSGPLRDLEGVVRQIRNRHRLVVSVSLLRRSVAVEIDPGWVITRIAGTDAVADSHRTTAGGPDPLVTSHLSAPAH